MDLRGLQIFIEVAELRSFTRAGERLGYSQPTVSFQIRQLEQEIGVPLFDRIGHTVSLTDAGRKALEYAHQICNLSQEMTSGNLLNHPVGGVISLGMADSLCHPMIVRNFAWFRKEYPHVALHIHNAGTDELLRMLDHNEVDLICTMDSRICNVSYIMAEEEAIDAHFVVSTDHPFAQENTIRVEQLLLQGAPYEKIARNPIGQVLKGLVRR